MPYKITKTTVELGDRRVYLTWEDAASRTGVATVHIEMDRRGPRDWDWYVFDIAGEEPNYDFPGNEGLYDYLEDSALEAYVREDAEYYSEENQRG